MTEHQALLEVRSVSKSFGPTRALDGVDLTVARGSTLAVVGPSGCGKSTLLRCVVGLTGVDAGTIRLEGREVAGPGGFVPAERRGVGIVFQDLALFPHLTVADNVAFGLRSRRERDPGGRVSEMLALVGLERHAARYPHQLSGGEQQRVAIARTLAPRPELVLLDEPFSHLDAGLAVQVREEALTTLREAGVTVVLVTHDQEEALAVGDEVAVLHDGRLVQVGTPDQVFHRPATTFVATFLGAADFLPARRSGDRASTSLGEVRILAGPGGRATSTGGAAPLGDHVEVLVRPHDLRLDSPARGSGADGGGAGATVTRTEFRGAAVLHWLRLDDGGQVRALVPHDLAHPVGATVVAHLAGDHPLVAFEQVPEGRGDG